MELVSIIIPAYNVEEYIAGAIDTVIAQTYPHIELIVVDDCSNDRTVEVASNKLKEEFKGHWQVIRHDTNKGVSAARNTGLLASKGAWLQFMDADDFLAKEKIFIQMNAAVNASSDIAAVYAPFQVVYVENGQKIPIKTISPDVAGKPPIYFMAGGDRIAVWACLFRREAVERVGGYNEALSVIEDLDFLVRIAQTGGHYIPAAAEEPMYFWRWYRNQPRVGGAEARYKLPLLSLNYLRVIRDAAEGVTLAEAPLAPGDRENILRECTRFARLLYIFDQGTFHQYMKELLKLCPNFKPSGPWYLTMLSRCIGYEAAEAVASLTRTPKNLMLTLLRRA
jgi:glycosyltransferase involved in cell wall biosynthesis